MPHYLISNLGLIAILVGFYERDLLSSLVGYSRCSLHFHEEAMKIRLVLAIAALWANGALAFSQEDVEKLRNTGSCQKCDLSKFQFPDKAKLNSADLTGAKLTDATLSSANLTNAKGLKRF